MTNIKSLCLGLFFLTIWGTTYGQTNKFDIGIEGSPSLIFLRGINTIPIHKTTVFLDKLIKPTIGFSGGLFFQYNFKKVVSLRTNIAFERKGFTFPILRTDSSGNLLGEFTANANYDYMTLPILVRATFGDRGQFFVNAGPYFGYLIKRTNVSKGDNIPTATDNQTSLTKRFDTGISTGLGLSVPIKTKFAFSFEVRNNLGLYNVNAMPAPNNSTNKTSSTSLILGFNYKLGQRTSDTK